MPNCKGNVPTATKQKCQTGENHPAQNWKTLHGVLTASRTKQSLLPHVGLEFGGLRGSGGRKIKEAGDCSRQQGHP